MTEREKAMEYSKKLMEWLKVENKGKPLLHIPMNLEVSIQYSELTIDEETGAMTFCGGVTYTPVAVDAVCNSLDRGVA